MKKILSIEQIFILIAVIFGVLMVFLIPPFYGCDEPLHFLRICQLSEGEIISYKVDNMVGGYLPKSLLAADDFIVEKYYNNDPSIDKEQLGKLAIPLNQNDKTFIPFPNSAIYSPVPYFSQSLGAFVASLMNSNLLQLLYISRLFNLVMWIILVYYAIKITPIFKNIFFLVALTPISLFQSSVLSGDSIINGLAFLIFALVLKYIADENYVITKKDMIFMTFLSVGVALSKQVYLPISLIFLLIPIKRFKSKKYYYINFAVIFLISLFSSLIWTILIKDIMVPLLPEVSVEKQLLHIINNPIWFISVLINTIYTYGYKIFLESFGTILGWPFPVRIPLWLTLLTIAGILITSFADNEKNIKVTIMQKLYLILVSLVGILAIMGTFYLTWNSVGASIIEGIQGRYLIPYIIILLLIFYNTKINIIKKEHLSYFAIALSIFILSAVTQIILNTYYV